MDSQIVGSLGADGGRSNASSRGRVSVDGLLICTPGLLNPGESGDDLVEALASENESLTCIDRAEQLERMMRLWRTWSGLPLPATAMARARFAHTLASEGDLSAQQVRDIVDRILPPSTLAVPIQQVLDLAVDRFMTYARPWFPIWQAYVSWTMHWCISHGYYDIVFLCRDALPLYVVARQILRAGEFTQTSDWVSLRLLHASRRLVASPHFPAHLARGLPRGRPVALVDTGCYGSLIPRLAELCVTVTGKPDAAAFFFFSRNPHIFGYINYLMVWENLGARCNASLSRSLFDFVIYAGDVLEAQPKAYLVERLHDDGRVGARPQDLITFVLACALFSELKDAVVRASDRICDRDEAHRAATELWRLFIRAHGDPATRNSLLLTSTAPKDPPNSCDYRECLSLPPQRVMFGKEAG